MKRRSVPSIARRLGRAVLRARRSWAIWLLVATVAASGCRHRVGEPAVARLSLVLATTTSTQDSGLLDELVPWFERQTGIDVRVVAVGSGQAMQLARRGDADVLLTHAPDAEEQFLREGHGERRMTVMYNRFLLVGPADDPAEVRRASSAADAFARIAAAGCVFVSRADQSGTHFREEKLWQAAGVEPSGTWYVKAGAGMAQTLRIADEKQAYTLTDEATFLAHQRHLQLQVLLDDDPLLRNRYSVILLSRQRHPEAQHEAARRLAEFLLSPDVQAAIGRFGAERFGKPLFVPVGQIGR